MAEFYALPFNNENTQKIQRLCPESTMAVCKEQQVFYAVKTTKPCWSSFIFKGCQIPARLSLH